MSDDLKEPKRAFFNELITLIKENDEVRKAIRGIFANPRDSRLDEFQKKLKEQELQLIKLFGFEPGGEEDMRKIIEKIRQWFYQNNESKNKLETELTDIKSEQEELYSELQEKKNSLTAVNEDLSKLSIRNKENIRKISSYEEMFREQFQAYQLFTALNPDTKSSLQGIFRENGFTGFLACGYQEGNIASFWDFIKDEIQKEKNQDIDSLIQIFNFFFTGCAISNPAFQRTIVSKGDQFDDEHHIRHSSSPKVNGSITEVIFSGWSNSRQSKIIKKTIVKMGGK